MAWAVRGYDDAVDDTPATDDPGERRPTRTLERAPSERYLGFEALEEAAAPPPPVARAVVFALLAAIAGGVAIAVAGEILKITAGLVVVAAALGWFDAVVLTVALGGTLAMRRGTRRGTAVSITLLGVALGQVGLWLIARNEGGVLGFVDYLSEVFGFLVPAEFVLAAVVAWWRAG